MEAGIAAVENVYGGTLESWVIIPRPHENVEAVLPIAYTTDVEQYRDAVENPIIPTRRGNGL
jgi:microcompartment protein CcmL/EutN